MKFLILILFFLPLFINAQQIFAIRRITDTIPPILSDTITHSDGSRNNLLIQVTFESPQWVDSIHQPTQECCGYSQVVETDTVGAGSKAMRIDLYKTDATYAASKRSEIVPDVNDPLNSERWLGVEYYFPAGTYQPDPAYEILAQWHPGTSNGSPPFSLRTANGRWFCNIYKGNDIANNPDNAQFDFIDLGPVTYDTWNKVVIHYKQASDATGIIQVWINGVLVLDSHDRPTSYPNITNYLKIGINKSPWMPDVTNQGNQTHRLFYIDEIRYGNENATYGDVVP